MNRTLYALSLWYLGKRPRSEKEMREFLKKKMLKERRKKENENEEIVALPLNTNEDKKIFEIIDEVEEIINKLKQQNFLNDLEFGKWWVEQRTRIKPKGWRAIEFELKQKGIDKDVLGELESKNNELRGKTEKEMALEIASKKIKLIKNLSREKIYQQIGGLLARRGFNLDTIKFVIDEVLKKEVK